MPALVNNSVGSLPGTRELDGTTECPFFLKNSKKLARISELVIDFNLASRFISFLTFYINVGIKAQGHADLGAGITTVGQETRLALLVRVMRRQLGAKLLLSSFVKVGHPILVRRQALLEEFALQRQLLQVETHALRPVAAGGVKTDKGLHVPAIVNELFCDQALKDLIHHRGIIALIPELTAQLPAGMVAPSQRIQRRHAGGA